MIDYFMNYFIVLDKEIKKNIFEILLATKYGNCHITLKNSPELINNIVNYIENIYKDFVHSEYKYLPVKFSFNNKIYELNFSEHENGINFTVWDNKKNEVVLHFVFENDFDFSNKIKFIKKILENKDIIADMINKYNLAFPDYLTQLFDKFSSRFGIFYK